MTSGKLMNDIRIYKRKQPWRDALIATTGLSVFILAATLLWTTGHPEWAFTLTFLSVWVLISISWSNIDFTEQSGTILARIMDKNFLQMHDRIGQLEEEISQLKGLLSVEESEAANHQLRD
jgi:hypothetical protein